MQKLKTAILDFEVDGTSELSLMGSNYICYLCEKTESNIWWPERWTVVDIKPVHWYLSVFCFWALRRIVLPGFPEAIHGRHIYIHFLGQWNMRWGDACNSESIQIIARPQLFSPSLPPATKPGDIPDGSCSVILCESDMKQVPSRPMKINLCAWSLWDWGAVCYCI